ncbi:20934_t:CDS:1, partial [Gigaspora margarita]
MALKEIGCNYSELMNYKIEKHQQVKSTYKQNLEKENFNNNEHEKKAKIFDNLFNR